MRRPCPRSLLARVLPLAVLPVLACTEHAPAYYNLTDEAPDTTASTAASFPEPVSTASTEPESDTTSTPTSSANASGEDAESTSSGDLSSETSGSLPNAPPEVYSFAANPDEIDEPGPVLFELAASADVVEVDVWHDGELLGTFAAADFPVTFEVTSQNTCQGAQKFTATVRDAEGLTADSLPADLFCQLPAPGSEVYTRKLKGVSSAFGYAVALTPDGGVVVAGALDGRMLLWRLDATGTPIAGWPKTIKDWTLAPGLGAKESGVTAVAVDATGAIIVAGFYKNGIAFRRYMAKLNDAGTLLWEDPGLVDGEEIAGLAVSELGDVVVGGSIRTTPLDQDARYDAGTWGYPHDYPYDAERWSDVFAAPPTDPHPDLVNSQSERWRAVLALPGGRFAVIGEREYKDDFDQKLYTRTTVLKYEDGSRTGDPWTSAGQKYANDAAMAGALTSTGFAVAGWCRAKGPNAIGQACVQIFDEAGSFSQVYAEPSDTQAACLGVAQDSEDRLVLGCYRTSPGQVDAWVFASRGAGFPLAWSQTFDQGGWDFAAAVTCENWGKCTWVGTTMENGAAVLVASQRYP